MKKSILYLFLLLTSFTLGSCKMGLDDLPTFEEAELLNFWFEHREVVEKTAPDGSKYEQVVFTDLKEICSFKQLGESDGYVQCEVVVNTQASPKSLDMSNIVGKATISTAAYIQPIDGSPQLGGLGNFTVPTKYLVTSADQNNAKKYVINVVLK